MFLGGLIEWASMIYSVQRISIDIPVRSPIRESTEMREGLYYISTRLCPNLLRLQALAVAHTNADIRLTIRPIGYRLEEDDDRSTREAMHCRGKRPKARRVQRNEATDNHNAIQSNTQSNSKHLFSKIRRVGGYLIRLIDAIRFYREKLLLFNFGLELFVWCSMREGLYFYA